MSLIDWQRENLQTLIRSAGESTSKRKSVLALCPHCFHRLTLNEAQGHCPYCSGPVCVSTLGKFQPGREIDLGHLTALDKLYIVGSADAGSAIWCQENYWTEEQYLVVMVVLVQSPYSSKEQKLAALNILRRLRSEKAKEIKHDLMRARRNHFDQVRAARELALIARDGYFCNTCGSQEDLTIDHKVPLSKGGTDTLDNLQFLCRPCNSSKHDQLDPAALDNLGL